MDLSTIASVNGRLSDQQLTWCKDNKVCFNCRKKHFPFCMSQRRQRELQARLAEMGGNEIPNVGYTHAEQEN
jgi:hypothetical protein